MRGNYLIRRSRGWRIRMLKKNDKQICSYFSHPLVNNLPPTPPPLNYNFSKKFLDYTYILCYSIRTGDAENMESKLTLKLNNNSISRAKEYVSQLGTSLSSIVENFFDNLTVNENKSKFPYSPLVNELSGIIHLDEHFDYKSDYTSYLDKKYE